MQVKIFEVRDRATFIPVICVRPVAGNSAQAYLLRRDGYKADESEHCVIMIDAQCRGVAYDPWDWNDARTKRTAHQYIQDHWDELEDGEVIDVQFILGETTDKKLSERLESQI